MAGYTPLFGSVMTGSLHGKYPDLPVWLVLLAMCERGGIVDATPAYIASCSGIPVADVEAAIGRFCEPDPHSRTPDNEGRRLEPLTGRGFGWRILNHERYRDRARKMAYDIQRTESGDDAARKKAERLSRHVPTSPDMSRPHTHTPEADSNSKNKKLPSEAMSGKPDDAVVRVFNHWRQVHGHMRANLDARRRKTITGALKSYSEADLCQSITGYLGSPFHMGQNDRATKYDDIDHFLSTAKRIDAGLALYANPPRTDLSSLTRKNVDAIRDWVPQELRNGTD